MTTPEFVTAPQNQPGEIPKDHKINGPASFEHVLTGFESDGRPLTACIRYDGATLRFFHRDTATLEHPVVLSALELQEVVRRIERFRDDFLKPYTSLESSLKQVIEVARLHAALLMEPASPLAVGEALRSLLERHLGQYRTDWSPVKVSLADSQPAFHERSSRMLEAWTGFARVAEDRERQGQLPELDRQIAEVRIERAVAAERSAGSKILAGYLGSTPALLDDVLAATELEQMRRILPVAVKISVDAKRAKFTAVLHIQANRNAAGVEFECQIAELTSQPVRKLSEFIRRLRDASAAGINEPRWPHLSSLEVDPPGESRS